MSICRHDYREDLPDMTPRCRRVLRERVRELLDASVDETLYATTDEMKAARDAAVSEGD